MATWMTPTHDTNQVTPWSEGPRLVRQNAFIVDPTQPYNPFDHINSTHSDESSTSTFSPITSPFNSSIEDDEDDEDEDDSNNIENQPQFYYHHTGQRRSLTLLYHQHQQQQVHVNDTGLGQVEIQNAPLYRSRRRIPLASVYYERRSPLPENTGDYDEPHPISATSTSDHDPQTIISDHSPFSTSTVSTDLLWPGMAIIFGILAYEVCACTELKIMPSERLHTADPSAPGHVWIPVFYWSCWNSVWFVRYRLAATFGGIAMIAWYSWLHLKRRS